MKPIRICFIASTLACLAVVGLNAIHLKGRIIKVQSELKDKTVLLETVQRDLSHSQNTLAKTATALKETEAMLAKTTASEQNALASLTDQTKRAAQLALDLRNISRQRDDALSELAAYHSIGSTEEIVTWNKQIKNLQAAITAMQQENKVLGQELRWLKASHSSGIGAVRLPANLRANIAVYDPKYQFVVLNAGAGQGVVPNGELLVNRSGKLIAKVRVSRTEKNRSVANLVSGWEFGEILEGDVAIPADPES